MGDGVGLFCFCTSKVALSNVEVLERNERERERYSSSIDYATLPKTRQSSGLFSFCALVFLYCLFKRQENRVVALLSSSAIDN